MGELTRQTVIAAPAERIFDFASNPYNAPSYISSIRSVVEGPRGEVKPGQSWRATANFLGRPAAITLRLARLDRPHMIGFILLGEPRAALTLRFGASGRPGETAVSLTLEVPSVPTFLLQGMMGGLLTADMLRLKSLMEKGGSAR